MQALLETFVLIAMLNPEPAVPSSNTLDDYLPIEDDASFPLRHERKIVDCLAFLFALIDDPTKVSALCLERDAERSACTVRVAMNTGVPRKCLMSFRKLARALEHVAKTAGSDSDENLLKTAIDVNRNRILSRLRSRHAPTAKPMKAAFGVRLSAMIDALSSLSQPSTQIPALKTTVSRLVKDIALLEATPNTLIKSGKADEKLLTILLHLENLPEVCHLRGLLNHVPADKFSNPQSLLLAITKLRNYRASCELLTKAVRVFEFFKSISVEAVDVKTMAPQKLQPGTASILEALGRLNISWTKKSARRFGVSLPEATTQFQREMAALQPKVHAEIQLVYHYEMNSQSKPPRIICSSKSACYLCDAFVKVHSRFFISRTHGVLYPQWTLPNISPGDLPPERVQAMQSNIREFTRGIENLSRDLWTRTKTKRMQPNESTLSLMCWTPRSSTSISTSIDQPVPGKVETKNLMHTRAVNDEDGPDADNVSVKAPTVDNELPRQELNASHLTDSLVVSSSTSNNLNCKEDVQTSANIRDHGRRNCVVHNQCERLALTKAGHSTSASLSHSMYTTRKIDFHDSGIQMVLEFPTNAVVSIATGEQSEHSNDAVVVDIATLSPGCEVTFDFASDSEEGRSIVLARKTQDGKLLWWKIIWRY